ncbi:hypothetical protein SLEP1_g37409 [Rubroshorea leprosula]|uniref:Uncharacterized protein n=1 Tax=Rubroshorea leprosula TaxID=152421 RepID=A0AAV5KUG6_9ROSI|nr:hypothetical protein SLEP1_g37409 [Rubroshorea leprosula]
MPIAQRLIILTVATFQRFPFIQFLFQGSPLSSLPFSL